MRGVEGGRGGGVEGGRAAGAYWRAHDGLLGDRDEVGDGDQVDGLSVAELVLELVSGVGRVGRRGGAAWTAERAVGSGRKRVSAPAFCSAGAWACGLGREPTEADGGEEGHRILDMVGRVDAEHVASAEAARVQPAGQRLHVPAQLLQIGEAHAFGSAGSQAHLTPLRSESAPRDRRPDAWVWSCTPNS